MSGNRQIEVRGIAPDELDDFTRSVTVPFLEPVGKQERALAHGRRHFDPARSWAAVDDGRFVGNAGVLNRDITLPGPPGGPCPTVPFAAVTAVGVHPTHRRRGVLRRLMAAMLDQARERGEAFAGLLASEAAIYGRFGFGRAVGVTNLSFRPQDIELLRPPPAPDLRLLTLAEMPKVAPEVFDRVRRAQPGQVDRNEGFWGDRLAEVEREETDGTFWAVADEGMVLYRVAAVPDDLFPRGRLTVDLLLGATPEIEAGLWAYLLGVDLVDRIDAPRRPVAEPFSWWVVNPRSVRTTAAVDLLWLRVLDVASALTARRYPVADRLVLEVTAPSADPTGSTLAEADRDRVLGAWVLEAGPDGASVTRPPAGTAPDLTLGLDDLGSLYLGGYGASTLAAGGRVEGGPAALGAADRLFAAQPAPRVSTGF